MAFFILLLLAPFASIRRVTWASLGMYLVVIALASPIYHRYTFMIELVMLSAVITLQDRLLTFIPWVKRGEDREKK